MACILALCVCTMDTVCVTLNIIVIVEIVWSVSLSTVVNVMHFALLYKSNISVV